MAKRKPYAITVWIFFGGQKLYQELRFVLAEMDGIQGILASIGLALDPLSIIRL